MYTNVHRAYEVNTSRQTACIHTVYYKPGIQDTTEGDYTQCYILHDNEYTAKRTFTVSDQPPHADLSTVLLPW